MDERPFSNKAEALLGVALPVTAMEEQQRRGGGAVRGEEVESRTGRITIDHIEMIRHAGANRFAAAQPIGEVPVAIRHGDRVVVCGVERLPIHRAVNNHGVPCCRYSNWYITQPVGSLQPPQTEPGWRAAWMACQIRCGVAGMSR